jgi:HSP20 family molecular chaperone IbpA
MQVVQPETVHPNGLNSANTFGRERATETSRQGFDDEPIVLGESLPAMCITETRLGLTLLVPLNGVDARHVYVIATPQAVVIEIRIRKAVPHSGTIYQELQDQCVTRELRLHEAIKKGSTNVRFGRNGVEITCTKEPGLNDKSWSEFMHLNTRGSLGFV